MMIFSLVAMIGLEKCCITSACLQWLCHSGERIVARGPLVLSGAMLWFASSIIAGFILSGAMLWFASSIIRSFGVLILRVSMVVDDQNAVAKT